MIKTEHKYHILFCVILISSILLKLHFVNEYSTYTDEILSALVAKSIGNTGLPHLPSHSIYDRALLHHYLLAMPISVLGINYFSMRLNSILFSSLAIWIIYLLGAKVATRKTAIAAALLLAINLIFNQYSLSGRMYMTYACFYILSIYFFYRGFIEGKASSKIFSIIFMMATMLSSEAGLILGPIFVFLLYVYRRKTLYTDKEIILFGGMVWVALAYFIYFYKIPGAYTGFTVASGQHQRMFIDLNVPVRTVISQIVYLWRMMDKCIPLSVPFLAVMTVIVVKRDEGKDHFPLMAMLPALFAQSFLDDHIQNRVAVTIVPFYILACCQLISTLWKWVKVGLKNERSLKKYFVSRAKTIAIAFTVFILISVPFIIDKYLIHPKGYPTTYFLKPFYDHVEKNNPKPAYLYVKKHAKRNDIFIQTTLEYGYFFLGDDYKYYYLRQKMDFKAKGHPKYVAFNKKTEPYYGNPLIDSVESLNKIINDSHSRIWLILGPKSGWSTGPEIKEFIRNHFQLNFSKNEFNVYSYQKLF